MKRRTKGILLAACTLVMTSACTVFAEDSVTVTDLVGRDVTIDLPVESCYLGYYYENFLAVVGPDAFTKVKATSLYDTEGFANTLCELYRENVDGFTDMIDIGSTFQDNFDIEKLIESDVDVAILGEYQYNALTDKVETLEEAGIPVVVINYSAGTEEKHVASTEILGQIFQVEDRAQEIIDAYIDGHHEVQDRVAKIEEKDRKTTFHEFHSMITSYNEIGLSNFSNYNMGQNLFEAGALDIADKFNTGDAGTGTTLDLEYILEQDPDAWFIVGGEAANSDKDGILSGYNVTEEELCASADGLLEARPGFENLKAVKDGNVYVVENNLLRTLRDYTVVEYIAKALYPEEFSDMDPEADMKEFAEKYLPSLPEEGVFFYHLTF